MASLFETIRVDNHLYVFYEGNLIYKQWLDDHGQKTEASMLFNEVFPNVKITTKADKKKEDHSA